MAEKCAWVTLATNDAYSLGALVLAHSLRRVATQHELVIMITPTVTPVMKERLQSVFSEVITVDVLDSKDATHLALLSRPELGITFTKIHCWTLTQYKKCVFLDADTLVFKNCDELFEREELSAAPDVGWPDCFNSGVFVFQPSNDTFGKLVQFAQEKGSFDGGDQGLLNQFFSNWAREDIKKHLPFVYNVCSTAFYSYLPALKQYGSDMKIMHFIGSLKPWLQKFNWSSRTVAEQGYLQAPLQYWWDIFLDKVHPCLDSGMAQWECGVSTEPRYQPLQDETSPFPWHHTYSISEQITSLVDNSFDFYDPWDNYALPPNLAPAFSACDSDLESLTAPSDQAVEIASEPETKNIFMAKPWYETYVPNDVIENSNREYDNDVQSDMNVECGSVISHCDITVCNKFHDDTTDNVETNNYQLFDTTELNVTQSEWNHSVDDKNSKNEICCNDEDGKIQYEEVKPRHPYDNFYMIHKPIIDYNGCKRCTHEELPPDPSPSPTLSEDTDSDLQAGIAGALSQLTIGTSEQGSAVDEHLRRQGWESGNIDYLGADAFDNIWAKISQTLSSPPPPPVQSAPAPSPPAEPEKPAPTVSDVPKSIPEEKKDSPVSAPKEVAMPIVPPVEAPKPAAAPALVSAPAPVQKAAPPAPKVAEQPPQQAEQPQKAAKDSKATIEEKQDSKQAETEAEKVLAISSSSTPTPKTIEKLVCHLLPIGEVEPLVTPENEHEDAASIAQSIIAREEALSTPTVISATPPASATICPTILQNIKDLSVDTTIPETPPIPGPVSLAQIGVIPTKKIEKSDNEEAKVEIPKTVDEPVVMICPMKPKKDESCKLEKTKSVEESTKTPVEAISTEAQSCPILKKQSSTEKCSAEKPKRSEKPKVEKKEPESPSETFKTPEPSEAKPIIASSPLPEKPKSELVKKEETVPPQEPIMPPVKVKKQKSKLQSTPSTEAKPPSFDADVEPLAKGASTPTELICKIPSSESKTVKETEKVEAVVPDPPIEKIKKPIKKPQPIPKADDTSVPESSVESASVKKSEDKPVPPPRKKEKKPKDKK